MRRFMVVATAVTLLTGYTQTDDKDYYVEMKPQIEVSETVQTEESSEEQLYNEYEVVEPPTTTFMVTAYCGENYPHICNDGDASTTATGTTPTAGRTIAVDPTVIPYGSEVILNGHTYIAEDCGGAIKGNRIDMFFNTHEEALQWGVKYIEGVVVK